MSVHSRRQSGTARFVADNWHPPRCLHRSEPHPERSRRARGRARQVSVSVMIRSARSNGDLARKHGRQRPPRASAETGAAAATGLGYVADDAAMTAARASYPPLANKCFTGLLLVLAITLLWPTALAAAETSATAGYDVRLYVVGAGETPCKAPAVRPWTPPLIKSTQKYGQAQTICVAKMASGTRRRRQ